MVLLSFLYRVVINLILINRMVRFTSCPRSFQSKCQRQEPLGQVANYAWTVFNEIQIRTLAKCQFVNDQTKQDHCGIEKVQKEFYLLFTQKIPGEHVHSGSMSVQTSKPIVCSICMIVISQIYLSPLKPKF